MPARNKTYLFVSMACGTALFGWGIATLHAYESAKYTVEEADGSFEVREYPDLMLATTKMGRRSVAGEDGSFMRLFRYISGGNEDAQKIAMTTPVFMEARPEEEKGQMGFVLPEEVATKHVPEPSDEQVSVTKRVGGRFAVIQFNGRMNSDSVREAEGSLRAWMKQKGLEGETSFESAGYDPPWTPGPLRRNEVLIRLKTADE